VCQEAGATAMKRQLDDEMAADSELATKKLAATADLPGSNLYLCQQKSALFFV